MKTGMNSLFEKKFQRAVKPAPLVKYFSSDKVFPDDMPVERLVEFQKESIREIVKRAYEHSPFYRERMDQASVTPDDIQELADLARLPFITKDDLRGNPWALLACDKKDVSVVQVSTGTTGGEEIYIMNTWEDYYLHELSPGYPKLFPVGRGDICFNCLPYEMSSAGLAFHKTFLEGCQATVVPAGKGGAYSTPAKTIKMMYDLQPTIVITTPSWAITLSETAAESSFDLKSLPLKKMWLTGEGCSSSFRDRVEQIWGTTANCYYGSLECGGIGVECDAHNGYHISMAHSLVEIVDPDTGEVLEPGEVGEIVVSCTTRYHTPILRYRTKDLGYIDTTPCSCGCTPPRLFLRGRLVDQIEVQGMSFSPYYLEEFLMRQPEVGNWFQFVAKSSGSDRVKIRCELVAGVQPSEELADSLASKMEYAIGIPFEFEFLNKMPRPQEKTVRVVLED
jgi:phenylacetate-CoA ligase